jgi:hypothetical protein
MLHGCILFLILDALNFTIRTELFLEDGRGMHVEKSREQVKPDSRELVKPEKVSSASPPLLLDAHIISLVSEHLATTSLLLTLQISKKLSKILSESVEVVQIFRYRSSFLLLQAPAPTASLQCIASQCASLLYDLNTKISDLIKDDCSALQFIHFVDTLQTMGPGLNMLLDDLLDRSFDCPVLFLSLAHCILTRACHKKHEIHIRERFVTFCDNHANWIDGRFFEFAYSTWSGHNTVGFRARLGLGLRSGVALVNS